VAITEIRLAPMARRISTPNNSVSAGVTTVPPPRPSTEPNIPAKTDIMRISKVIDVKLTAPYHAFWYNHNAVLYNFKILKVYGMIVLNYDKEHCPCS
jgi:hypothetical protein